MSLLMQALKKAERAKQSQALEEELHEQELSLSPMEEVSPDEVPHPPAPVPGPEEVQRDGVPDDQAHHFAQQAPSRRRIDRRMPEPVMQPRTMRIAALLAGLLLLAAVFGYMYWNAVYGAGSSRNVPPVPMPGLQGAAPAAPAEGMLANEGAPLIVGEAPPQTAQPVFSEPAGAEPAATLYAPVAAQAPAPAPAAAVAAPLPSAQQMQGLSPEDYSRMDRQAAAQQDAMAASANSASTTPARPSGAAVARPSDTASYASDIQVSRTQSAPAVNPLVQGGYTAFRSGDLATARAQYQAALQAEPANRDALLGLAALAVRDNQPAQAAALYGRLLEGDPRDPEALSGMAALGSSDSGDVERRLRRALEQHPGSASALFALGSLYARQHRWSEAQQLFFKAHAAQPAHPDYAFNLAVGLDRLNQPRLARDYYARALALAEAGGPATFDRAAAANRLRELAAMAR
jgi:tetratricopeptide (TPR) repeat protein